MCLFYECNHFAALHFLNDNSVTEKIVSNVPNSVGRVTLQKYVNAILDFFPLPVLQ